MLLLKTLNLGSKTNKNFFTNKTYYLQVNSFLPKYPNFSLPNGKELTQFFDSAENK